MSDWQPVRANTRKQLAARYKHDLEKGLLTDAKIKQMVIQLETALEKTKKSAKRVIVEGQEYLGTLGIMEIEDQISALQEAAKQ
jgi:hypothetical protein